MNFEFMTIDTPLPPCMPFPRALTGFPVSSTAKVMYCRMLDAMLSKGQEDENGILFVCFPVTAIAAVLSRSPMTVKRSLNELETAGLIMRVRQGVGEPNRIYVLITQNVKDLLASPEVSNIFENSDFVYMLNQANGDRQILAKQLNISPHQLSYVTHSGEGEGLLFFGNVILPFVDHFPKDLELYRILTTRLSEVAEAQKHE